MGTYSDFGFVFNLILYKFHIYDYSLIWVFKQVIFEQTHNILNSTNA